MENRTWSLQSGVLACHDTLVIDELDKGGSNLQSTVDSVLESDTQDHRV